jgi:hypothetical protein
MTRRLLAGYLGVTLVVLLMLEVPLAVLYAQRERDRLRGEVEQAALTLAVTYEEPIERQVELDPRAAEEYSNRADARVVVTDVAGTSLIDTRGPALRDLSTSRTSPMRCAASALPACTHPPRPATRCST